MPYFICPNCKERSVDHDRVEGLTRQAVACHRCGFGFLFELMDDYYPGPNTGLVVCDQEGRILAPMRDAIRAVIDDRVELDDGQPLMTREVELNFAAAYDKFLRAYDGLELSRDLVAGVRDYLQSKISNDQNEVMKKLTVIASVLLLPTFIVGLYGQNFHHIPELGWAWGYWWAWGWIVATTIGQLVFFRWKKWF